MKWLAGRASEQALLRNGERVVNGEGENSEMKTTLSYPDDKNDKQMN